MGCPFKTKNLDRGAIDNFNGWLALMYQRRCEVSWHKQCHTSPLLYWRGRLAGAGSGCSGCWGCRQPGPHQASAHQVCLVWSRQTKEGAMGTGGLIRSKERCTDWLLICMRLSWDQSVLGRVAANWRGDGITKEGAGPLFHNENFQTYSVICVM